MIQERRENVTIKMGIVIHFEEENHQFKYKFEVGNFSHTCCVLWASVVRAFLVHVLRAIQATPSHRADR